MHNTFLLNYDPTMTDPSPTRLLEFVRSNGFTYQYLVPFDGLIAIKSTAFLFQMIESYRPFLEPNAFILTHVFPSNISGLLQPNYWDWLNANSPPPLPVPPYSTAHI